MRTHLADENATVALGKQLGRACTDGAVVYLQGDLGAGKTTLCRGVLRAFGHRGAVKSPSYTLVEPYVFDHVTVYHFDLYRLGEPEELEYMGVRDYFEAGNVCLVEWPERGRGILPSPDLTVSISTEPNGRSVTLEAETDRGAKIIAQLDRKYKEC